MNPKLKFLNFRFSVLLIEISTRILFSFFIFESHGYVIASGKNLPIGSETIFFEFIPMHGMLYIIFKHFLHWFQKYKVYGNWMNLSNFMKNYHFRGQNDNFAQKRSNYSHVIHYYKANQVHVTSRYFLCKNFIHHDT